MRAPMRSSLLAIVLGLASGGCAPNPFCLNCTSGDGGGSGDAFDDGGDNGQGDLTTPPDLTEVDDLTPPVTDMQSDLTMCAPAQLQVDPHNCGVCGKECLFPNAAGLCVAGKCVLGDCQTGFVNYDGVASNGCEYLCTPTNMKICDNQDNFCDHKINEGFSLATDVNNCGACGNACSYPNATGACVAGQCQMLGCKAGYVNLDKNAANGCEYMCPVFPIMAETCNGVDDDCNGQIDDNPRDVGGPCDDNCPTLAACVATKSCSASLSACAGACCGACTEGRAVCAGGKKLCQAGIGATLEVCNGLDDDCDGQIDNGFDITSDPLNCGACNTVCKVPNAIPSCTAGKCTILSCKPGFADVDKKVANGCEYSCPVFPPSTESCNGVDDDCNGLIDDSLTTPASFCIQTSICAGTKPTCNGKAGWQCNYQATNSHIEVDSNGNLVVAELLCDGFDGNCNGQVDESFPTLGKSCGAGVGKCAGLATITCTSDHSGTTCPAVANPMAAVDEVCNGIDDNCDGSTDERTPTGNPTCYNGGAHACKGWVDPMVKVGATYVYQYEASHPDATATGVGSKTGRACANPGVLPWSTVTWQQAHDACAAIKDSAGNPLRLCHAPEWMAACNVGNASLVWAYASAPTTYAKATCNGIDAGNTGAVATASLASCYAAQGGGHIYDMSGNVSEWTDLAVTNNGKTYYQVLGGAYNSYAVGTSCNFTFTIEQPTYEFNTLGFRCCADAAP